MKYIYLTVLLLILSISVSGGGYQSTKLNKQQYFMEESLRVKKIIESERRDRLIESMIHIESRGDSLVVNEIEQAVGVLQIRPIMVREVNRLLEYKKYKLSDRLSKKKSIEIFRDLQTYYNPHWDEEQAARIWNGGPRGMEKKSTISYWSLVKKRILKNS